MRKYVQSDSLPDFDSLGFAMQTAEGEVMGSQERRILKERFVKEQSNYGRVNYGMRVAWVDREALVTGQIFPK
jgi:hypothetical protein